MVAFLRVVQKRIKYIRFLLFDFDEKFIIFVASTRNFAKHTE